MFSPLSELPPELIAGYAEVSASTLGHLGRTGYLPELKPVVANTRLLGQVVTARIPLPHGALLREVLIASRPGDVMVIEAVGDPHCACWGELRTLAALAGVVVSGAITDVQALRHLGLPIFHRGISAITTQGGEALGKLNVQLRLGETHVCPGDLALGDDDGPFVLSPERAAALLPMALDKEVTGQARRGQLMERLTRCHYC